MFDVLMFWRLMFDVLSFVRRRFDVSMFDVRCFDIWCLDVVFLGGSTSRLLVLLATLFLLA